MIKGIIFDLDGIIVDSEPFHFEAAKKALQEFGFDLTVDEYLEFGVSKGARHLFEKLTEKHGLQIDMEKAFKLKKDTFKEIFEKNIVPRKGIVELLERFNKKYVLAIASSGIKESVYLILRKLDLENYFKTIITAEDVDKVKPAPDLYLKSCESLGLKINECIAIEDSETGLKSAKAAGLKCIVVPCEFTKFQNFSGADLILRDFSELTEDKIESLA